MRLEVTGVSRRAAQERQGKGDVPKGTTVYGKSLCGRYLRCTFAFDSILPREEGTGSGSLGDLPEATQLLGLGPGSSQSPQSFHWPKWEWEAEPLKEGGGAAAQPPAGPPASAGARTRAR